MKSFCVSARLDFMLYFVFPRRNQDLSCGWKFEDQQHRLNIKLKSELELEKGQAVVAEECDVSKIYSSLSSNYEEEKKWGGKEAFGGKFYGAIFFIIIFHLLGHLTFLTDKTPLPSSHSACLITSIYSCQEKISLAFFWQEIDILWIKRRKCFKWRKTILERGRWCHNSNFIERGNHLIRYWCRKKKPHGSGRAIYTETPAFWKGIFTETCVMLCFLKKYSNRACPLLSKRYF